MTATHTRTFEAQLDALLKQIEISERKPTLEQAEAFADLLHSFAEADIAALMNWLKNTVTEADDELKVRQFLTAFSADEATHGQARQFLTENAPKA